MIFAIVDIETTGGNPEKDKITEIAIILHDGYNVISSFHTLVNPKVKIPFHIFQLTGITDEMLESAPEFHEVAKNIIDFTNNAIFVAHNVRFDYSFIKSAYKNLGYVYQRKTLCTVRLSRQVFKNIGSYSLGKLCESLRINIYNRHRAMGDAEATAELFSKLYYELSLKDNDWINNALSISNIPPLLDEKVLNKVPEQLTGVYYFYNSSKEIIYIGKGNDIKKRIEQHFSISSKGSRRALKMKSEIADISYEPTGNELIALLLESDEIKKHKPIYNIVQKKTRLVPTISIYSKLDSEGYKNLYIDKYKLEKEPIVTTDSNQKARDILYQLTEKYNLCLKKMDLFHSHGPCFYHQINQCKGACIGSETSDKYNQRFEVMIKNHSFSNESFILIGKGRNEIEQGVVLVENGQYQGFGFVDISTDNICVEDLKSYIKKYQHNKDIQNIILMYQKTFRRINLK